MTTKNEHLPTPPDLSVPAPAQPLQRQRTAGTYRRLATLMAELGWAAVRVCDLARGGHKEQRAGQGIRPKDRKPPSAHP
jgi:hypothetical protein